MIYFLSGAQELKKSVTWENLRAHPAPLPVAGELNAVRSLLDAPSCWSVGVETMDRDYADFEQFKQYVGETGVGYGRLQSGWAKTEQKKGKYDFRWLDAHVDGLLAEGVHPWMCLCYGNPVYSKHGHDLNAKLFPDGPIMNAWLRYVKACVARYKGKVTMWEVWNEPDGRKNLDSYALYANLFVRTAQAIREEDPGAKIAAFGSCSPDREYIRQAMELIAFPMTALGSVGASLGLLPSFEAAGFLDGNAIAVCTAIGMCWSGYLSTHTAMLDSLGWRKAIPKALGAHTIAGLCAGIIAHFSFLLIGLL